LSSTTAACSTAESTAAVSSGDSRTWEAQHRVRHTEEAPRRASGFLPRNKTSPRASNPNLGP
jgi:hypothetical protein